MERILQRIVDLDPGLWKTAQDIAREGLGIASRWRGKSKTGVNLTHEQAQIVLHLLEGDYLKRNLTEAEEALRIKLRGEK
jgi:hypothetical protein